MYRRITDFVNRYYAPDLRALALLRMAVALVTLADLGVRWGDLSAHYTDAGMWPREVLRHFGWADGYWSLFLLSGSRNWALLLFAVQLLLALALLLGLRTRLATALLWLFYISLHNRNLYILQAGDDLLRLTLFWGIFLPWQNAWSMDAARGRKVTVRTLPYIGYLVLQASVYFFSAILKTHNDWYAGGDAVYFALSLDQLRLWPLGDWLYQHPTLMRVLTRVVLGVEFLVPLLILWPQRRGHLRGLACLCIVLLHLGFGSTLYVGFFFLIGMATSLGLLPGAALARWRGGGREAAVGPQALTRDFVAWPTRLVCAAALLLCLFINLSAVPWFPYRLRKEILLGVQALRFEQYWGMFSPHVMRKDGWFVYYGIDAQGRQWDLRLNQDYVDFHKPARVSAMYRSDRWRKLAENMQNKQLFLRPLYCSYLLRTWNKQHPEKQLATLNLYYMLKENLPGYKSTVPAKQLYCVCIAD